MTSELCQGVKWMELDNSTDSSPKVQSNFATTTIQVERLSPWKLYLFCSCRYAFLRGAFLLLLSTKVRIVHDRSIDFYASDLPCTIEPTLFIEMCVNHGSDRFVRVTIANFWTWNVKRKFCNLVIYREFKWRWILY